jgi:hypothetical protein
VSLTKHFYSCEAQEKVITVVVIIIMIKLKRTEGNISFQKKIKLQHKKRGNSSGLVFPKYRVQMARRVQSAARACPLMSAEGEASIEQSMNMPLPSVLARSRCPPPKDEEPPRTLRQRRALAFRRKI